MKLALATLITVGAALSACADYYPPGPPIAATAPPYASDAVATGRQCFRTQDIRNHTIDGDRTLYLDVRGREVYRVDTTGSCLAAATSSDPLVIRQPPGSPIVCGPIDLDISIARNGFESRCIVNSIVRLTPEQVAALPPKLRP
jgi:hypothetical protein